MEETAERYIRPELRQTFVDLCRGSVGAYLERFEFKSDLLKTMYAVTDGEWAKLLASTGLGGEPVPGCHRGLLRLSSVPDSSLGLPCRAQQCFFHLVLPPSCLACLKLAAACPTPSTSSPSSSSSSSLHPGFSGSSGGWDTPGSGHNFLAHNMCRQAVMQTPSPPPGCIKQPRVGVGRCPPGAHDSTWFRHAALPLLVPPSAGCPVQTAPGKWWLAAWAW